jgi:hypothetical protein
MPQDSKRKRHLRRVRRDRSLAYRMVNQLLAEREMSRKIITGMGATIERMQESAGEMASKSVQEIGELRSRLEETTPDVQTSE